MTSPHSPKQNHILAALPPKDYVHLLPYLELVSLPLGWAVYEAGVNRGYVYFPTTCVISKLCVTEDGSSTAIAVVGNEGAVGISLIMGGDCAPSRAVVHCAGYAYRMKSVALKRDLAQGGMLRSAALLYTQALITQMAQTTVCNRLHSIDQRLCRWLLLSLDRTQSNSLTMTQEFIGSMLGVRRETVTGAAGDLQQSGIIKYHRGHITVLNRDNLEKRVCECYAVVKKEYDRLRPHETIGHKDYNVSVAWA